MTLRGRVWIPIGPSPMIQGNLDQNGRVSSIYVSPTNRRVIYLGYAGGGLWKRLTEVSVGDLFSIVKYV